MTATPASLWVRSQSAATTGMTHHSIGMDFVLGDSYGSPWDVGQAVDAYAQAVAEAVPDSDRVMVALVVPLTPVRKMSLQLPDLEAPDVHDVEPPSLYLFDRRVFGMRCNYFEEYRVPLEWRDIEVPVGRVCARYSCFRDAEARENGWEFSRAIWFEHFHTV